MVSHRRAWLKTNSMATPWRTTYRWERLSRRRRQPTVPGTKIAIRRRRLNNNGWESKCLAHRQEALKFGRDWILQWNPTIRLFKIRKYASSPISRDIMLLIHSRSRQRVSWRWNDEKKQPLIFGILKWAHARATLRLFVRNYFVDFATKNEYAFYGLTPYQLDKSLSFQQHNPDWWFSEIPWNNPRLVLEFSSKQSLLQRNSTLVVIEKRFACAPSLLFILKHALPIFMRHLQSKALCLVDRTKPSPMRQSSWAIFHNRTSYLMEEFFTVNWVDF